MEIEVIGKAEMESRGGFGGPKTWDHEAVIETLQGAYEANEENLEDGETLRIKVSEEEFYEEHNTSDVSYKDYINSTKYPHPAIQNVIESELENAGFLEESTSEKRKSAVGGKDEDDGYKIKVELAPA